MTILDEVERTYRGSDGAATRQLYGRLEALGSVGHVAVNLLRACKCSERAKLYRKGPGHIGEAYARKDWSVGNLARILGESPFLPWGWGLDVRLRDRGDPHHHVLYVETPFGQVSFHTGERRAGPDHARPWDGARDESGSRACRWAALLLGADIGVPDANPPPPMSHFPPSNEVAKNYAAQLDLFGA